PANGIATAEVNVHVRETSSGNPVPRGTIYFSATSGSITSSAAVNESGRARGVYTAGEEPATVLIRARWAERIEDTVSVVLMDPVASLTAQVRPSSILANGQDEAQLTVRLGDLWGEPVPNQLVRLEFDGPGRGEPTLGRTDAQGIFLARIIGNPSVTDGSIRVIASLPQRQMSREVSVITRGVTLNLSADALIIPGDGRSTINLTASVFETSSGNPVVGDTVRFTTTGGVIQPFGVLNRDGVAQVTLRSPPNAGLAQVVARYGADSGITDTLTVAFAQRFSFLNISVEPNSLLADGRDSARVIISLQDTLGNSVPGVWVTLATTPERQVSSDSVQTDQFGRATAYVFSFASGRDTSLALTVRVGHLVRDINLPLRGVRFSLVSDPDTLPANGRSRATMTASVSETTSGNPVVGRVVRFSTNLGVV
ncbi:MAG: Ig-like domain-containing protein, partial [bacterium]